MLAGVLATILAGHSLSAAHVYQPSPDQEFVGTTLCGREVREFIGGLPSDARCHAITWRLTLRPAPAPTWKLAATYGVPATTNPNAMVDGPSVALQGTWRTVTAARSAPGATRHQLTREGVRQSLSFAEIHGDLLHLLADDGGLMVGTGGWSYTLNRAGRAEKPGEVSRAADMSYTISPRATGSTVSGVFEGRTPCRGVSHQMKLPEMDGCLKVKWRVTLYQDPATAAATTYKVEHVASAACPRRDLEDSPATVRRIGVGPLSARRDADRRRDPASEGRRQRLLFVDEQFQPLIGTAEFSYTLNRVPSQVVR